MDASAGGAGDAPEPDTGGVRRSGRRALRATRDDSDGGSAAFWDTDIRIPVITRPSPVLGATPSDGVPTVPSAAAAPAAPARPVAPTASVAPVVPQAPADRPAPVADVPVRPADADAPTLSTPATVDAPAPAAPRVVPTPRPTTGSTPPVPVPPAPAPPAVDLAPSGPPVVAARPPSAPGLPAAGATPWSVTPSAATSTAPATSTTTGTPPTSRHAEILEADLDSRPAPVPVTAAAGSRRPGRGGGARTGRARRPSRPLLGLAGGVLVAAGVAVPFVLSGLPFGADVVTVQATPTAPPTTPSAASTPSGGPSTATAAPTSSRSAGGRKKVTATTTAPVEEVVTVTRTAAPSRRATTTAPRTTRTATPARTTKPPAPPVTTRPGEVLISAKDYTGKQWVDAHNLLRAKGVAPVVVWVYGTGKVYGTVVDVRPSGWVRDGAVVYTWVAAS